MVSKHCLVALQPALPFLTLKSWDPKAFAVIFGFSCLHLTTLAAKKVSQLLKFSSRQDTCAYFHERTRILKCSGTTTCRNKGTPCTAFFVLALSLLLNVIFWLRTPIARFDAEYQAYSQILALQFLLLHKALHAFFFSNWLRNTVSFCSGRLIPNPLQTQGPSFYSGVVPTEPEYVTHSKKLLLFHAGFFLCYF